MTKITALLAGITAITMPAFAAAQSSTTSDFSGILDRINLPDGFKIEVFAEMPKPRTIEVGKPNGVIFVGSRHGHIYSMTDFNRDGKVDEVLERASELNVPNSVAMQDAFLFIALQDSVVQWAIPAEFDQTLPMEPLLPVYDGFLDEWHHGWRYMDFGPDRKIYVSLGVPCNICELTENTGKIIRMDPDGSNVELVADGVRNSVGFDWHPVTQQLWFTDNGADGMGDDIPADELNRVSTMGEHFGFPYYGGADTKIAGYEDQEPGMSVTGAEIEFQAHSANLGIDFYTGDMFPAEYKNDAFVAQHGSWNRTEPVGYRIMRVIFDDEGNPTGKEVFADGWLDDEGNSYGRVTDLEEMPDGSLLVSDDFANVIYRISYDG